MKNRIRLLAIDIDGTLLDTRFQLSQANRQAVLAAREAGVEIVLVTGRRFGSALPIVQQLPIDLTVISSGGAVVKSKTGATLWRQLLRKEQARAVLAAAGRDRKFAFLLFDREGVGQIVTETLQPEHPSARRYLERSRPDLKQVARLEDALTEDPIQVLFAGALAPLRQLEEKLKHAPFAHSISLARTEYPLRDLILLDVLDRACNKGRALARWAAHRGLRAQETMAIGDNWNDREMLEFAGLPVLMGNSSEELKQTGWAVTGSNDEDGVAAAITRYLLSA